MVPIRFTKKEIRKKHKQLAISTRRVSPTLFIKCTVWTVAIEIDFFFPKVGSLGLRV